MGYLKSAGTTVIYIGAFLALITFIPGLPPDATFTEYSFASPKELTGSLAINEKLNNAEILFKGQLKGPESFASYNGELYTGVHGGYVMKIAKDKLVPVVKFGKECDGIWQESKCGRPLGMQFDKAGSLYVADAYYGIFKVNVKTGKYERLVDSKKPIEGKVPHIINSLAVATNGDIYWSDSSTEFALQDGVYTLLANPSGRLIRYNAVTKKNEVLIHDLGFPNGVALSNNEEFVIVSELTASRIIKYNIKGPKANKHEIFIDQLPGLPDNIHSDNQNGFLVGLTAYADTQNPQLFQSLAPHPYIRRMVARLLALLEAPFKCLQSYYPNYYAEKITHYIGGFESMLDLTPEICVILRIDNNGVIKNAAFATDKKVAGISSAYIHDSYLWLGSPFSEYVSRVPLRQAFPELDISKQNTQKQEKKIEENKMKSDSKPSESQKPPETMEPKPSTPKKTEPISSDKSTKKTQKTKKTST